MVPAVRGLDIPLETSPGFRLGFMLWLLPRFLLSVIFGFWFSGLIPFPIVKAFVGILFANKNKLNLDN
jgi:hypothetical protein